jgi:hypothetical protein
MHRQLKFLAVTILCTSSLVAVQQYGQVLIFAMDEDVEEDDEDDDDEDDLRFLGWFLG